MQNLIEIKNLNMNYPINTNFSSFQKKEYIKALHNITLNIQKGEILGLVGESGCGKSTLGKAILRLITPEGCILYKNTDILSLDNKQLKAFKKNAQMVFQNPYSSLNPRMTIYSILKEPLVVHGLNNQKAINEKIYKIIELTGLTKEDLNRYPHEFSGGQRQRIAIARALILEPEFLVADEPVSALDVSIQAQIISLLKELKEKLNLTVLFISHDLGVIKYLSDRIVVMYLGDIVEMATSEELFNSPKHPYTQILISSVASIHATTNHNINLKDDIPSPKNVPQGCKFHTRCPYAMEICSQLEPTTTQHSDTHFSKCHLYKN